MIEVENLSFRYKKDTPIIIDNLNLSVEKGKILSILGKNGVGKTTFLKCLSAELTTYTGNIFIDDTELKALSVKELSKSLALVASNAPCYQNLMVSDYLVTGYTNQLAALHSPNKYQYEQAELTLSKMGQSNLFYRNIFELSSGEMQIVKIARAIIQNPKIILFDEPTSNLDVKNQLLVLEQITALSEQGYTVITTTHNPGQSLELGGKVLMLTDNGFFFGKSDDILSEANLRNIYDLNVELKENEFRKYAIFENNDKNHRLFY